MEKYLLVLDMGTTNVKASLIDHNSKTFCNASSEFPVYYPEDGLTEESATVMWGTAVEQIRKVMTKSGITEEQILSIGITNQRETFVIWNKRTGVPVYNAIGWADCRGIPFANQLIERGYMNLVYERTGNPLSSINAVAAKAKWVLDNVPGVREQAENGDLLLGTVETWIIWKLTEGKCHVSDYSNASHSMLMDIKTLEWDPEMLDLFQIPASMLPKLVSTSGLIGYATGIFHRPIPITGAMGDSQSAAFGHMCLEEGMCKASYGTACLMIANMGTTPKVCPGLITSVGWKSGDKISYLYEGGFYTAGLSLKWLKDTIQFVDSYETMNRIISCTKRTPGFYFSPTFLGVATPYYNTKCKAMVTGMQLGTNKNDVVKAIADSIAYMTRDCLDAFAQGMDTPPTCVMVDGGVTKSDEIMQFNADVNGIDVLRSSNIEATTLGVAYAAGIAAGYWKDMADVKANIENETSVFHPVMEPKEVKKLYDGWLKVRQYVLDYANSEDE